jgi:hypothetical protein
MLILNFPFSLDVVVVEVLEVLVAMAVLTNHLPVKPAISPLLNGAAKFVEKSLHFSCAFLF